MASPPAKPGTLYLMPVWLGEHGGPEHLTPISLAIAERTTYWFCENERSARRALRRMSPTIALDALTMHRLDERTTPAEIDAMIGVLREGHDAAITSEAGMPAIADPGALLVQAAHRAGVTVAPLSGPSSIMLALAASGLDGQRFSFHGYLPVKPHERKAVIKRLELDAARSGAQLFIETPYRNDALLADLLAICAPGTLLCIAIDLTQPGGSVITRSVAQWRNAVPTLGKRPAIFILGSTAR